MAVQQSRGQIKSAFENRIHLITEEDIIRFSKDDNAIFNVVQGFHKEAFGLYIPNGTKGDFEYVITYIGRSDNKLEGCALKLRPHLKVRNELTGCFAHFIHERYKSKDASILFNTYQDQQRTLFERLDYWTYDDTLINEIGGRRGDILIKDRIGLLYVPFVEMSKLTSEPEAKKTSKKSSNKASDKEQFVYIMYDERTGFYKIGRSVNAEYREKTLQSDKPVIILIEKWVASAVVEGILHRKYKEKRIRGEWFELSESDLDDIRLFMAEFASRSA